MPSEVYVKYDDPRVEYKDDKEDEYIEKVAQYANELQHRRFLTHGHCYTTTHVKTQGLVKGTLSVCEDIPSYLAQGLFMPGKQYPVAMRYSTETMARIDDRIPQPRGLAMKIFNVDGKKMRDGQDPRTQDIEFNNAPAIELRDAKTTAEIFEIRTKYDGDSDAIHAELKKREDYDLQVARDQLPNVHLAALRQYSQSAFRHGDYIAKYSLVPSNETLKKFESCKVTDKDSEHVLQTWLQEYFIDKEAVYELQAQILTEALFQELDGKAVEDSGIEWDSEKYLFVTIAKLTVPPQNSSSQPRRVFWEDNIRLDPWHGLELHKPLGSTNRLRRAVYTASSTFRRKMVCLCYDAC